jgi:transcription elongation GreA/GreB family factor
VFSRTAVAPSGALLSSIAFGLLARETRFASNEGARVVSKFLPKISQSVSDRLGFEQLAFVAAAAHHRGARFPLEEIGRAEIIPDDADDLPAIVTMGSSVRYRLNWGSRAETRMLAYPEEYASNRSHFSVRSPLGAASIGLKPGSRMPYFTIEGWMHMVEADSRLMSFHCSLSPGTRSGAIRPRSGSVCRVAIRSLQ